MKLPNPLLIFSQSAFLVQDVATKSNTEQQIVQIQISWLLQKPTDLDLHCLQRQGLSGFNRTRVEIVLRDRGLGSSNITYMFSVRIGYSAQSLLYEFAGLYESLLFTHAPIDFFSHGMLHMFERLQKSFYNLPLT